MRIIHVVDRMDPKAGGVCQAIRMIIESLSHGNTTNEVVSVDDPEMRFTDSFKIMALGPAENPWQYSKKLFPWLINNLVNYDIVIVHGLWQYYGCATYKALKNFKERKPLLYTMPHGMLDPYFQNAPDRKFKSIRNRIYWEVVEKHIINNSDAIFYTCETEMKLAKLPFKAFEPKLEKVVGLGIKSPPQCTTQMLDEFYRKVGLTKDDEFILFLGRIHTKKGIDLLIKAYLKLLDRREMPKLVIAGPGLESNCGRLIMEIIAERPEFESYFIFPGMLKDGLKWGAFYACDAFILPSHQENFGIATVEALACGKAVLISNQVNIFKEIQEHNAGLVECDTLEGVSILIERWISTPKKSRDLIANNARYCYKKLFQYQKVGKRIFEINNQINETFKYSVQS